MEKKEVKSFFGKPTPLGEVLEGFLKKEGLFPQIHSFILLSRFGEWFPHLADFCQPTKLREGVLYLEVNDPLWTLEVKKCIPDILLRCEEEGLEVKKIKIQCRY
ncbi:MAG TPA: DUF721 domain-containing protein [Candidatus Atribacteria bacterium]|jgi:predicted nucleic acid-binding Zn ribbon protein|uniref:DUF721 domain-containing protein n=1 Tax=Candidatus Sordicultor fermentans TaxID=1953203 RepID=UPI0016A1A703|nr:DUF721 domain-containing protein [Atribacterota bacterium]NLY04910.1 DUF721 domain-containing protein [Candidatus Atribacteria bacterium]MDI9608128.1 DUF721 domain-containing protein [Atribacterota bacterium]HOA98534.1 DUF721 domain-containing protein [Candidatus Atribacteria bacterium]HOQ50414.1 DUF721 domain-containing protein [Candidatus Atribacteria bacterium]